MQQWCGVKCIIRYYDTNKNITRYRVGEEKGNHNWLVFTGINSYTIKVTDLGIPEILTSFSHLFS